LIAGFVTLLWFIAVYVIELTVPPDVTFGVISWFSILFLSVLFLALGLLMPKKAECLLRQAIEIEVNVYEGYT